MATAGRESGSSQDLPSSQPLTSSDRRLMDKALKRLDKLHRLCINPRLALRNSPPYLPDVVSETATLLTEVWEPYRGAARTGAGATREQGPRGDEAVYLRIHIKHLLEKTDKAVQLFKEGRDKMFVETSNHRRNLTKLTLLFSHMLCELRAIFPGGRFQGDTYRLTKTEAGEFWRQAFGNNCIVQWSSFKQQLRGIHPFEEGMEAMALKSTVDLTCNDHISVFEFDIFTRLFQPWRSLLRNWNQLAVTHPGYMAFLTYDQVKARLEHYLHRPGSYIFRLSCTRMGQWAIGHVTNNRAIIQTIPQNTPLYQALIQGFREGCYLYPDGRDVNPDLTSLCEPTQRDRVKVTEEQYEIYCDMGSTFQLCKICTERDKNTRIQPCGHLLCKLCLTGWQKSDGHTCPYCRCDIRGTESILIEPYLPRRGVVEEEEEEEDGEDDLEDVELVIKKLASLKRTSTITEDYQVPVSQLSPPPLPPKLSMSSPCPSPRVASLLHALNVSPRHSRSTDSDGRSGKEFTHRTRNTNRCKWEECASSEEESSSGVGQPQPDLVSHRSALPAFNSVESISLPHMFSSSSQGCGEEGAARNRPSNSLEKTGRQNQKEGQKSKHRKERQEPKEMDGTISS